MCKQLEIELNTLLDYKNFNLLFDYFQLGNQSPLLQYNYYYDTKNQALKNIKTGFRLRTAQSDYSSKKWESQWTLKQIIDAHHSYEYHEPLDEVILEAPAAFSSSLIKEAGLLNFLAGHHIHPDEFFLLTYYQTQRWLIPDKVGEFSLDATLYPNGKIDYELELETNNLEKAQAYLKKLLNDHGISFQQADNKLKRALKNY